MLDPTEIKVMLSAAFKEAYLELAPEFERTTGNKVTSLWVPSVKIMSRLQGGETVDVVILSAASLDELIRLGMIAKEGATISRDRGLALPFGPARLSRT